MLGKETDLFVIDLISGKVHNLGEGASMASAKTLMDKLSPKGTPKQKAARFLVISGTELGYSVINRKTRQVKSLYNKGVTKTGKHFSSY